MVMVHNGPRSTTTVPLRVHLAKFLMQRKTIVKQEGVPQKMLHWKGIKGSKLVMDDVLIEFCTLCTSLKGRRKKVVCITEQSNSKVNASST